MVCLHTKIRFMMFINKYKKTPIPLVMGMNCMFNTTLIEYIVLN